MEQLRHSEKKTDDSYNLKLQYECDICPIIFNKHISLTAHKRIIHGSGFEKKSLHEKEKTGSFIGHLTKGSLCQRINQENKGEKRPDHVILIDLNSHWTPLLCLMLLCNFVALVCSINCNIVTELTSKFLN